MKLFTKALPVCALALVTAGVAPAHALDTSMDTFKPYVGAMLGVAKLSAAGSDFELAYGLNLGGRLNPELSAGLWGLRFTNDVPAVTAGGTSTSASETQFGLESNYHFKEGLEGFQLGAKLGYSIFSVESTVAGTVVPGSDQTFNGVILGPTAGYEYMLTDSVSFGGRFDYLFNLGSGDNNLMNLVASGKLHF